MIRLLQRSDIDLRAWDACVDSDPRSLVYGRTFYLDGLRPDWCGLVEGDYRRVMPLFSSVKWGIRYGFRAFGAQQLGVFGPEVTPDRVEAFLNAVPRNWPWVDLYLNEGDAPRSEQIPQWRLRPQPNYLLDLDRSYEAVYAGYNTQTVRNLRKSEQAGFRIFEQGSPEALIALFQENRGRELPSMGELEYATQLRIQHQMLHRGMGLLWMVHDERNSPAAGVFCTVYRNRITLLFSGQSAEGRERSAMTALWNALFLQYSMKGYTFDFEGSADPGIQRFVEGFGAVRTRYLRAVRNRLPFPLNRWMEQRG
ncbi:hypothetical protein GC167_07795 [bacterium]|nr:hypothetical protein [bacterium]